MKKKIVCKWKKEISPVSFRILNSKSSAICLCFVWLVCFLCVYLCVCVCVSIQNVSGYSQNRRCFCIFRFRLNAHSSFCVLSVSIYLFHQQQKPLKLIPMHRNTHTQKNNMKQPLFCVCLCGWVCKTIGWCCCCFFLFLGEFPFRYRPQTQAIFPCTNLRAKKSLNRIQVDQPNYNVCICFVFFFFTGNNDNKM